MKTIKRITLIMLSVVMMLSMSVFAEDIVSPSKQSANATFTNKKKEVTVTYNGKTQKPKIVVKDKKGKVIKSKYYKVTYGKNKNTGKYTIKITGKGKYKNLNQKLTLNIQKAKQTVKVSSSKINVKAKSVAKKSYSKKIKVTKKAGKITYKSSDPSQVTVNKGKITVKKGAKKGTYIITVSVKGAKNYKDASKKIKVVVK